jgi:hypothetical protein
VTLARSLWLLAALVLVPLACRNRSEAPRADSCPTIAWGGWDGTPECAGLAATVITGRDRACATDMDCALIAASHCDARSVNDPAAPRYADRPPPCNHPLAGMCLPAAWRAACQQGCCVPLR